MLVADAAGEGRDVVDVGLGHHVFMVASHVAGAELVQGVLFPQRREVVVRPITLRNNAIERECAIIDAGRS